MQVDASHWFTATVVPSAILPYPPRFYLNPPRVMVGPYQNAEEYDEHMFAQTTGTNRIGWDNEDEYRFDVDTGLLCGLYWIYPEQFPEPPEETPVWEEAAAYAGVLRLDSLRPYGTGKDGAPNTYSPNLTSTQLVDPKGTSFTALNADLLRQASTVVRLQVAQDLYLLIADEEIAGWVFLNPGRYLTALWEALPATDDDELGIILAEYLTLATCPNLDEITSKNPESFDQLVSLYARLGGVNGDVGHRQVLRMHMDVLAYRFYDRTISGGPEPTTLT